MDKGVALVVMDKEDYVQKAKELLDQPTYKNITNDPTLKHKNKFVNILKAIKTEGEIDEALYKKLYPTGAGPPKCEGTDMMVINRMCSWLVYDPTSIPRQLRFSLYSGAVITEGLV